MRPTTPGHGAASHAVTGRQIPPGPGLQVFCTMPPCTHLAMPRIYRLTPFLPAAHGRIAVVCVRFK
ncbi:MAG: hypothetical protein WBN51_09675 [Gammaproteobacteria bacterium]